MSESSVWVPKASQAGNLRDCPVDSSSSKKGSRDVRDRALRRLAGLLPNKTILAKNSALPTIDLRYGDRQSFGVAGNPQPLINVLGSVVFVVHHSDVSLYRVRVESLDSGRDAR